MFLYTTFKCTQCKCLVSRYLYDLIEICNYEHLLRTFCCLLALDWRLSCLFKLKCSSLCWEKSVKESLFAVFGQSARFPIMFFLCRFWIQREIVKEMMGYGLPDEFLFISFLAHDIPLQKLLYVNFNDIMYEMRLSG